MSVYTTSSAVLEALSEAGVDILFTNFGSDHTGVIEAIAAAREQGRRIPRIVTVPAEMVAMSAAHGHAQLSGRAQAVLVHVECGTQSLGGAAWDRTQSAAIRRPAEARTRAVGGR